MEIRENCENPLRNVNSTIDSNRKTLLRFSLFSLCFAIAKWNSSCTNQNTEQLHWHRLFTFLLLPAEFKWIWIGSLSEMYALNGLLAVRISWPQFLYETFRFSIGQKCYDLLGESLLKSPIKVDTFWSSKGIAISKATSQTLWTDKKRDRQNGWDGVRCV